MPAESDDVLSVALFPESVIRGPKFVPSIANCTAPDGLPAPGGVTLTVAVKVTFSPGADGFLLEDTARVVDAGFTVSVKTDDVVAM